MNVFADFAELFSDSKILIVDDVEDNRVVLQRQLERHGYQTSVCEDGVAALAIVSSSPPDLVILDWMMPNLSGLETLKAIREHFDANQLPVIMCTARDEETSIGLAIEAGANDYIQKPVRMPVLLARISAQLIRKGAMEALGAVNQDLENTLAQRTREYFERQREKQRLWRGEDDQRRPCHPDQPRDRAADGRGHLLGVRGRRRFARAPDARPRIRHSEAGGADRCESRSSSRPRSSITSPASRTAPRSAAISKYPRSGSSEIAVLFLDLDRFKEVNDTLGHKVGDGLLKGVADRLRDLMPPETVLARIGGDEFAAILKTSPIRPIDDLAIAIVELIYEPFMVDNHLVHVGASVGVREGHAADGLRGRSAASGRHCDVRREVQQDRTRSGSSTSG